MTQILPYHLEETGYSTTVYLYPPPGASILTAPTPQGNMPVGLNPCHVSPNVHDIWLASDGRIEFTKRTGEKVISNAVYMIVQEPKPESEA